MRIGHLKKTLLLLLLAILINSEVKGQLPAGFQVEEVLTNLNFPVTLAFSPDGRLFFNELKNGNVRVVQDGVLLPQPYLTVSLSTDGERGLIGLAFDPDFEQNRFVYIFHTNPDPLSNRVVRFKEENGVAVDPVILMDVPITVACNHHNSGNLRFGPDGMLYVTIGDYGCIPDWAQDLTRPQGKIHRINPVDGSAPIDNPFFDDGDPAIGNDDRIFAFGLRNSFDFVFNPVTDKIFATENGPADNDEVNIIKKGGNYGWPIVRGVANNPDFIDPILTFTPTIAPTGITFYSGDNYPNEFKNDMFFADFNAGKIRRVKLTGANMDTVEFITEFISGGFGFIIDVVNGPDGFIYFTTGDAIFRIVTVPQVFRVERSTGNVFTWGSFIGSGADLSELINVSEAVEPGDVVELDPNKPQFYRKAHGSSQLIAGVITTEPGFILGNNAEAKSIRKTTKFNTIGKPMLALMGTVPVKVTTENGSIRPGDLLTVSSKPGYAMLCRDIKECEGAIVGKALEGLESGDRMILVLVTAH